MIHFDSEKALEDIFVEYYEHFAQRCFHLPPDNVRLIRQPKLPGYGVGDVLFVSQWETPSGKKELFVTLFELKNTPLKYEHFGQVARYKTFFEKLEESLGICIMFDAKLIVLQTDFKNPSTGDLCFLAQTIDWLRVHEVVIKPHKGIDLKEVAGWTRGGTTHEEYAEFMDDLSSLFHNESQKDDEAEESSSEAEQWQE